MFYVYILQSESTGRFYVGYSESPDRRLLEHNVGKVKSTRNYRPWLKVYQEEFSTEVEAIRRERFIKSMKSRIYIQNLVDMKKLFFFCILLLFFTSCRKVMGDRSLGNHITLLEKSQAIVYCGDQSKACSDGLLLIEDVDDYKWDHDWVIVRTIKDNKKNFWIINKDFTLGDEDCRDKDCGDYIKTYVSGPLSFEDFEGSLEEWDIGLYLPKE